MEMPSWCSNLFTTELSRFNNLRLGCGYLHQFVSGNKHHEITIDTNWYTRVLMSQYRYYFSIKSLHP